VVVGTDREQAAPHALDSDLGVWHRIQVEHGFPQKRR
jgi:hypothetical protein